MISELRNKLKAINICCLCDKEAVFISENTNSHFCEEHGRKELIFNYDIEEYVSKEDMKSLELEELDTYTYLGPFTSNKMFNDSLYINSDKLFNELLTIPIKDNSIVHIATYSIYIDIAKSKDWSKVYGPSKARQLINKVKDLKEFKLMVGAPYYIKDLGYIREYIQWYNSQVNRLIMAVDYLKLNCRVHESSHLKYYRIDDRVFIGGINLSSSDWVDAAVEIHSEKQKLILANIFEQAFNESSTDIKQYLKVTTEVRK